MRRLKKSKRRALNSASRLTLLASLLVALSACDSTSVSPAKNTAEENAPQESTHWLVKSGFVDASELAEVDANLTDQRDPSKLNYHQKRAAISPSQDAYVRDFGGESYSEHTQNLDGLVVKNDAVGDYNRESHLHFDLSNYEGRIESATLHVHRMAAGQSDWPVVLRSTQWDGSAFRWQDKPSGSQILSESSANPGEWDAFKIDKSALQASIVNNTLSVSLSGKTPHPWGWITYASADHANGGARPVLVVELGDPGAEAASGVRYLRMVVRSEENGFGETTMSELNAVDGTGALIDRSNWQVLSSTSSSQPATRLLDNDRATLWQVKANPALDPHEVVIDMGATHDIHAVIQSPRLSGYMGRPRSTDYYAAKTVGDWKWIGHQSTPHADGNSSKVTYTNASAAMPQLHRHNITLDAVRDPYWESQRTGSRPKIARVPAGLWNMAGGSLTIEVPTLPEGTGAFVWRGPFAGNKAVMLKAGLNVIPNEEGHLFFALVGDDPTQSANFTVNGSNIVTPPVFRLGETSNDEWPRILASHTQGQAIYIADNISVVAGRDEAIAFQDKDVARLMGCYQKVYEIEQYAQHLDRNAANPLHEYDNNRLIFLPWTTGYMFAGDHYMGYHTSLTHRMLDPAQACYFWGVFHEIGHRQQYWAFTWAGANEVTVNIYSRVAGYNMTSVEDRPIYIEHTRPAVSRHFPARDADTFDYASASGTQMQAMFDQLWLMFGDQYVRDLHKLYREDINSGDLDLSGEFAQLRQFTVYASRATGYNLDAFFTAWKFPMNDAVRAQLNGLGLPRAPDDWKDRLTAVN